MKDPYEDPEVAIEALEGVVENIVANAMAKPLEERTATVIAWIEGLREVYAGRLAGDDEGLADAMELAGHLEAWAMLRVAELEAGGLAGRA